MMIPWHGDSSSAPHTWTIWHIANPSFLRLCLHHARGKAQSAGSLFQHLALAVSTPGGQKLATVTNVWSVTSKWKKSNWVVAWPHSIKTLTGSQKPQQREMRDVRCRSVWMMIYIHSQYHPIHLISFNYHQLAHRHVFPTSGQMFATMVVLQLPPKES